MSDIMEVDITEFRMYLNGKKKKKKHNTRQTLVHLCKGTLVSHFTGVLVTSEDLKEYCFVSLEVFKVQNMCRFFFSVWGGFWALLPI